MARKTNAIHILERAGIAFEALGYRLDMEDFSAAAVAELTGYQRGGVTAIGLRKPLPIYLDRSATNSATIAVSGGAKGVEIVLATQDYCDLTGAVLADAR